MYDLKSIEGISIGFTARLMHVLKSSRRVSFPILTYLDVVIINVLVSVSCTMNKGAEAVPMQATGSCCAECDYSVITTTGIVHVCTFALAVKSVATRPRLMEKAR